MKRVNLSLNCKRNTMKTIANFLLCSCFAIGLFAQEENLQSKADTVYSYLHVDQPALFPGCENKNGLDKRMCAYNKLENYIKESLQYPEAARKNFTQGKCVIEYTVQLDGSISDIELVRDLRDSCGEEALRIFKELKNSEIRFAPALLLGDEVAVRNKTVVRFYLSQKGIFTPKEDDHTKPKEQEVQLNRYNK